MPPANWKMKILKCKTESTQKFYICSDGTHTHIYLSCRCLYILSLSLCLFFSHCGWLTSQRVVLFFCTVKHKKLPDPLDRWSTYGDAVDHPFALFFTQPIPQSSMKSPWKTTSKSHEIPMIQGTSSIFHTTSSFQGSAASWYRASDPATKSASGSSLRMPGMGQSWWFHVI